MAETPSEPKNETVARVAPVAEPPLDAASSPELQSQPLSAEQTAAAIQGVGGVHGITSFVGVSQVQGGGGGVYVVEEDVIETLADGRQILVAAKGTQMPMAQAEQMGLLKPAKVQGPREKKPRNGGSEKK